MAFTHIQARDAFELVSNNKAVLVDTRDEATYASSHAPDSIHLSNNTIHAFLQSIEYSEPIIVMCYHGISSQGVAQFLIEQGFEEVYSVVGGFEHWSNEGLPTRT